MKVTEEMRQAVHMDDQRRGIDFFLQKHEEHREECRRRVENMRVLIKDWPTSDEDKEQFLAKMYLDLLQNDPPSGFY